MLPPDMQARQDRLLDFQHLNRGVGRWSTPQFRAGADRLPPESTERTLKRDALTAAAARAGRSEELARLFELAAVGSFEAAEEVVGFRALPCTDDELFVSGEDLDRWRRLERHLRDHALAVVTADLVAPGDAASFRSTLIGY